MSRAFVVKAISRDLPTYGVPGVFESFQQGKARIGWSYADDLDLRSIVAAVTRDEWANLSPARKDAWRCHGFLDRVSVGDYLAYPHQPTYGEFSIVQVTGEYDYAPAEDSLNMDFRSFRPCRLLTPTPIDWNDQIVPPLIKRRLGLQGRFYELYDFALFGQILNTRDQAGTVEPRNLDKKLARVFDALSPKLLEKLVEQFPQHDLSWLCEELFSRMGYSSVIRQEGPFEKGADLLVTVGSDFLPRQFVVGVQVFAYSGDVTLEALTRKLDQLLSGWDENGLDYGALVTTGLCGRAGEQLIEKHNNAKPNRLVALIDAIRLSNLFLSHFEVPKI